MVPPGMPAPTFRLAEGYIKAYFLHWEEFVRWCQVHLAEYRKYRILALVDLVSEVHGVKKSQKAQLLAEIEACAMNL